MLNLSRKELNVIAKIRGIKGYKSIYVKNFDDTKPKVNFSKARIEKIRKEFNESRHEFSKSKINEIRRNLYEIENEKNLFASKKRD